MKSEAKREAHQISVGVDGGTVTLGGEVHSYSEKDNARWAAWAAPGVTDVKNNLLIRNF